MHPLAPLPETWIRLSVVSALTGTPESSMRDAIRAGTLVAIRHLGAWHTSLGRYNEWIEQAGKRGRDAGAVAERKLELLHQGGGPQGSGFAVPEQERSGREPAKAAQRGRKKRRRIPIVYEICDGMAE
jgi:hypothetical protein